MHMLSLVCIAREFFFFLESACDQHRANRHYPDRALPTSFNQYSAGHR
ncbi:unnamed protein product [Staurois parvus]|uniref:Uncharacterized protein n=1 Tax=Staurois parvus TaxID=386267 RepID=A0ABN9E1S2_9NEOB|nr:unnamed protein product [Staurois parvus]